MGVLGLVVVILLAVWAIGAVINVVGAIIHAVLVIALILAAVAFLRRSGR